MLYGIGAPDGSIASFTVIGFLQIFEVMVRTNSNDEEFDDKKANTARKNTKAAAKNQKGPSSGIWPCKINGCNKQFAREADLKRHQRTTKLHSMPGL
ncbi:hypothetical protein MPER_10077 [Moniliophthora perniciosa FA553]|nr:hypothetical protein MPER_10077 [Moniliophthora perniciosa FA553]